MPRINIAIDGPTASGKGTLAKHIAKELGFIHLDTGAMYRAVAYYMKQHSITPDTFTPNILENISISFDNNNQVCLNKENIENKIRNPEISKISSDFSTIKTIREFLVKQQQSIVAQKGFVAEGRDIATKVIPEAELKIYLTASVETRAQRRHQDYKQQGLLFNFEEIIKEVEEKDNQDMTREFDPLTKTKDAVEIDNSELTMEQQMELITTLIKKIE